MINPFLPILNSYLPEPHASLLNGILFGVKATMPKDFYNALQATGTMHIIALSGMNISILVNLIARLTLFLGRKRSIAFSLVAVWLFVWFVGSSPSVIRAAGMGSVSILGVYFGRQTFGLLTLLFVSGVMLLFDLSLVGNISFQLSFLATLGIILAGGKSECQKVSTKKQGLVSAVMNNFRLTLSAQLFTLPIILYNFHRLSLIAPLANVLTEWVIQPIMILGFIAGVLGVVWWPLGFVASWIVWVPLTYFIQVIQLLAKIPGASVKI